MKKKLFVSLTVLVLCALVCVLPAAAAGTANGSCGQNAYWSLDAGGTLRIYGSGAMEDYSTFSFGSIQASPPPWVPPVVSPWQLQFRQILLNTMAIC